VSRRNEAVRDERTFSKVERRTVCDGRIQRVVWSATRRLAIERLTIGNCMDLRPHNRQPSIINRQSHLPFAPPTLCRSAIPAPSRTTRAVAAPDDPAQETSQK
jgi:hypothetical protein